MKFKEHKHIKIIGDGQAQTTSKHIVSTKSYKTAVNLMQILIDEGLV
jgi:hypothetical protein